MKLKFRIFQCLPFYPSTQSLLLLFEPSRPPGEVGGGSAANKQWLRTKLHELTKKKTSMIFANYSQEASLRPLFHFVLATLLWSKCLTKWLSLFRSRPTEGSGTIRPSNFQGLLSHSGVCFSRTIRLFLTCVCCIAAAEFRVRVGFSETVVEN